MNLAPFKPKMYKHFIDDMLLIWPHRKEKLMEFLTLLNNLHQNSKFTVELEIDRKLPFLDILLMKKLGGSLGHTFFRKPTLHKFICQ